MENTWRKKIVSWPHTKLLITGEEEDPAREDSRRPLKKVLIPYHSLLSSPKGATGLKRSNKSALTLDGSEHLRSNDIKIHNN